MLPTKLRFIWPNGFRGEDSKKSANQKQESPVVAMFVMDRDGMSNNHRGSSIDASYQVSDHLANGVSGEEFYKSANQKQESPVVAMFANGSGRNEQSLQRTFHRCFLPNFDSFGQAVSEEKIFKNLYRDKCILNTDIYI